MGSTSPINAMAVVPGTPELLLEIYAIAVIHKGNRDESPALRTVLI
jgi:hypothetical protein